MSDTRAALLERELARHGLVVLGRLDTVDGAGKRGSRVQVRELWLAGNAGPGMWTVFRASPENVDGQPDPLDRWTRRVGEAIAAGAGARAVFPFDGPPYPPFQRWALRSGEAFGSPIGIAIHRRYGLWHGYRFALVFDDAADDGHEVAAAASPCVACADRPCLETCPVGAFTSEGYNVGDCAAWLRSRRGADCMARGCAARRACPVGREWTYEPGQASFHMRAFLGAMGLE